MSTFRSRPSRRLMVGLATTALLAAGVTVAPPSGAVENVSVDRIAGANRYSTAAAIAGEGAFGPASTAILATGENFPDALAASGLAGASAPAPILLTTTDSLSSAALTALDDLGVASVTVVGGTAAVSPAVVDALEDEGYAVDRVAGVDRYETAAAIAAEVGTPADLNGRATAVIATGLNFPDALTGGTIAYVGGFPLLLTNAGVPRATEDAIDDLGIEQVIILGGTAAVPTSVETQLESLTGNAAIRLAGPNRFGTAVEVAEFGIDEALLDATEILLAAGFNFPDALAGGPLGGELTAPILLMGSLPKETEDFLVEHTADIETLIALGGTAAIDEASLQAAEDAAEDAVDDGEPEEPEEPDPVGSVSDDGNPTLIPFVATAEGGTGLKDTTLSFTGLDNSKQYDVAVFPAVWDYQPTIDRGTSRTFADQDPSEDDDFDSLADYECRSWNGAKIVTVNGDAPSSDQCSENHTPISGSISVKLTNVANLADSVWVVVWFDADDDDELDLTAADVPLEVASVKGPFVWHGGPAKTGATVDGHVLWISRSGDWFVTSAAGGYQFRYDNSDSFNYGQQYTIDGSRFEAWTGLGDRVRTRSTSGTLAPYSANVAATSTFSLYEDGPIAPTSVTAAAGDFDSSPADTAANDIRVTWAHNPALGNMTEDVDGHAGYCVSRYAPAALTSGPVSTTCYDFNDGTAAADAVLANRTATLIDVPAGSWVFAVTATTANNNDSVPSDPSATVTSAVASTGPRSVATGTDDVDGSGKVSVGDILTLFFDKDLDGSDASDTVTLRDNDNTTCTLTQGSNAEFDYPAATTLTITVTDALVCSAAGTIVGLAYPATVTATSGINGTSDPWDLANSPDKRFE